MAQPLIILGISGNALDILDIVDAANREKATWEVVGFLDDSRPRGSTFEGIEILGGVRDAVRYPDRMFVNAIGSDKSYRKRPELIAQTRLAPEQFATLIHPHAAVSPRAKVGPGTCVNAGVILASGVRVGSHVWLGAGCVIGHDTVIEDYSLLAPRAVLSGFVQVGPAAYVGGGASVRQRVVIGERALVGLGGVVINDVPAGTTVVGNPARVLVRVARPSKSNQTPLPQPGLPDRPTASSEPPTGTE